MASFSQSKGKYAFQIPLFSQDLFFLKPNSPEDGLYLFRESSGKLEVGPSCPWEMELAGNLVETLVGILWWIVKYLQHKNQFIWKQMYKCLASFPVSEPRMLPCWELPFYWHSSENGRQEAWGVSTATIVLQTGIVLDEFILREPPSEPQIHKEETFRGEKAKPIKFDIKCRRAPMKAYQSTHSIAPNEIGY